MLPGILGTKIGMTHLFNEEGKMVPVTVIQAGPVYVTQIKTEETDGYTAVQVGFGDAKESKLTFPKFGHLKKAGLTKNVRTLREFRIASTAGLELGQEINVGIFAEGEKITVTGTSKGRGFAGTCTRGAADAMLEGLEPHAHRRVCANVNATGRACSGRRARNGHGRPV